MDFSGIKGNKASTALGLGVICLTVALGLDWISGKTFAVLSGGAGSIAALLFRGVMPVIPKYPGTDSSVDGE